MGTKLHFSTTFHLQIDGHSERTIQTLEDMLRACVLQFKGNWDTHLPLMEFAYNNSYHSSWDEVSERKLLDPEFVQITAKKIDLSMYWVFTYGWHSWASKDEDQFETIIFCDKVERLILMDQAVCRIWKMFRFVESKTENVGDNENVVDKETIGRDDITVPAVGMQFKDEKRVYDFYARYAYAVDFPIRKRSSMKDDDGF
ncbi:uncharacterized protein LOC111405036 [Olea europaea var. sylvestris]|uniref:uncharacterized protein LOC111405036 n=1 Tax=Olea europaea var. sylvestris TaxID=158386 RepID=UPI000C1D1428|nr:uncharacterized protein LOC111405036 [Olea europaea var. sylvestris]